MKTFTKSALLSALMLTSAIAFDAGAVTDKEMDEARAIAAKEYLRWANDGSGYLDEFSVKSMTELQGKLKAKEVENLKAFTAVKTPGDFSGWDKAKLVEYWSSTFFTSPGLDEKGKGARSRVRKKLEAMTIAAPAPAEKTEEPSQPSQADVMPSASDEPAEPVMTPDEIAQEQQDILNDQKAMEEDARLAAESRREEQSHTWVYVLVLAILVGVVIWLVVYAANLMKRQPSGDERPDWGTGRAAGNAGESSATDKDAILAELHKRVQHEENLNAELGLEIERLKLENSRLSKQLQALRQEKMKARTAPEPVAKAEPETPRTIYLGRVNRNGIFVRADRRVTPGNTIYRLDTKDGLVGTFKVVDQREVVELALSNPTEYLGGGCVGEDLLDTNGVEKINTISDGTAIFDNGYWKVLRKTRISYE